LDFLNILRIEVLQYTAGNIKNYLQYWFTLTKNPWILKIIQYGLKLDFIDIPCQNKYNQNTLSIEELDIIDLEIEKLLTKKVVTYSKHEPGEFISGLFTRPKKDGSKRMILNLKRLNLHIEYNKFKMESIQNVLQCIEKNCYVWRLLTLKMLSFRCLFTLNIRNILNLPTGTSCTNLLACLMVMDQQ